MKLVHLNVVFTEFCTSFPNDFKPSKTVKFKGQGVVIDGVGADTGDGDGNGDGDGDGDGDTRNGKTMKLKKRQKQWLA